MSKRKLDKVWYINAKSHFVSFRSLSPIFQVIVFTVLINFLNMSAKTPRQQFVGLKTTILNQRREAVFGWKENILECCLINLHVCSGSIEQSRQALQFLVDGRTVRYSLSDKMPFSYSLRKLKVKLKQWLKVAKQQE